MNEDDFFDLPQYPNFLDSFDDFVDELFEFDDDPPDLDAFITCPLLPLRDTVLFPQMIMPLFVGRDRSMAAVQAALENDESIVVTAQRDPSISRPGPMDIYAIGTEINIGRVMRLPDQSTSLLAQGRYRIEIVEFIHWEPYIRVRARYLPDVSEWTDDTEAQMRALLRLFEKVVDLSHRVPDEAYTFALNISQPGWLADFIISTLDLPIQERQEMIETLDVQRRLQYVSTLLAKEINVLELENVIHSRVQSEIDRSQREHFLREQMRAIQGELGEGDIFTQELDEIQKKIAAKTLPDDAQNKAEKELARLRGMPPMSPEVGIIRTYLDWILDLPWLDSSEDNLDVNHAADVLDDNHYALGEVKDRILEFIAVKQLARSAMRSPILCFVGPPGTGKTSLGRSIATALNREFVRVSLGGVRDEAEIRGHRRTYIGALPGRIIQGLRRAGTNNPLYMLDEVDKLGQDFRGDPAAALLEVLDPEQNAAFVDHYLELDMDLSQVLFVATANTLHTIPPALLDRMEVIEFSGYMEEEKVEISRQFLIERQLEQHGLADTGIRFETETIRQLIRQYTNEAGVRNLEREIANVCRKIARRVAEKKRYAKRISPRLLDELLGPGRFSEDLKRDTPEIGVITGLAWTPTGGHILDIEVTLMPGKGKLTLTGQMGDVMQESAQAALSYTRSQADRLLISPESFEQFDIHLHIPAGAVPKDGPSAGAAMTLALISAFTQRPVRADISLTGEITLRGRILPVGGVREKALAARRAGIDICIIPQKNHNDLQSIPKKLRDDITFIEADHLSQIIDTVLLPSTKPRRSRRSTGGPPRPLSTH
ncbi:MAG TPA: endopeptidase La [Anaerolineae bacterium]|nr:endopeptidase La [Anaerolineae bacterium]